MCVKIYIISITLVVKYKLYFQNIVLINITALLWSTKCPRMQAKHSRLWFKVSRTKYDMDGGIVREGGNNDSSWWKEAGRIKQGYRYLVWNNLVRLIGDETQMFLWSDLWLEGGPLCHRFCCLFDLAENQLGLVVDMSSLGRGVGGHACPWCQRLLEWEEEEVCACYDCCIIFVFAKMEWMISGIHN